MKKFKKLVLLFSVVTLPVMSFSSIAGAQSHPSIETTHSEQYPLLMFRGRSALDICKKIYPNFSPEKDGCYVYANCTNDPITFHEKYWANEYQILGKKVYADWYQGVTGYPQQGTLWYRSDVAHQTHYDIGPGLALSVTGVVQNPGSSPSVVFSTDNQLVSCS